MLYVHPRHKCALIKFKVENDLSPKMFKEFYLILSETNTDVFCSSFSGLQISLNLSPSSRICNMSSFSVLLAFR